MVIEWWIDSLGSVDVHGVGGGCVCVWVGWVGELVCVCVCVCV